MKSTYLIQRLKSPHKHQNPFGSFGGGLKNGGISDKGYNMLKSIFSFDYMGAAEFEFGAVPESLERTAKKANEYGFYRLNINKVPVYVICKKKENNDVESILILLSKDLVRLKESSHFNAALGLSKYYKKEDCSVKGWMELDNDFMFFVDKDMAEKTAQLFQIEF